MALLTTDGRPSTSRRQLSLVAAYFAVYVGYLFIYPEGELMHWVTLVLLPVGGLAVTDSRSSRSSILRSIGLDPARATHGIGWVLIMGGGFQCLQLLNARQREEFLTILGQPFGVLVPFVAMILLLGTAATTEEVFFRGILQRRLTAAGQHPMIALLVATAAFTLYHLPYAYLKPSWPSAGNLMEAVKLAVANGTMGGLALGLVFWRGGENLFASILLHALINLIPATRLVARLIAGWA